MFGWLFEWLSRLDKKATPQMARKATPAIIVVALICQTVVQVVSLNNNSERTEAGQKRIVLAQLRTNDAVRDLAEYVKGGVLTKAEAGYLWRKRGREEIEPLFRRVSRLEKLSGTYYGPYKEDVIDLPGWDESTKPPSIWLEDKASGE